MTSIDLNADLGEGFDDDAMLPLVTSANLACGYHAGDALTMARVCALARRGGVRIGAQVSYRDREGFGRRDLEVPHDELAADVLYQVGALSAFGDVVYLKPHGALYNRCMRDEVQARAVIDACLAWRRPLPILGLPNSILLRLAFAAGLPVIQEGYADRAMTADGRLAPRSEPGAVITDPDAAARRAVELARGGTVQTICVHGDTPGAAIMAQRVRGALIDAGFRLEPFV